MLPANEPRTGGKAVSDDGLSNQASVAVVTATHSEGRAPALAARLAFATTVDRLEQLVDQETQALRDHRPVDMKDFNHRKSQAVLELSRVMRGLGRAALEVDAQVRLARLRARLDDNQSVLRMHLRAAQEISTIISRAIQEAEFDGTYSVSTRALGF